MTGVTLDELALRYNTDKASDRHGYTQHYERLFSPWRDRKITLLEIGVLEGGSLRMWRDYFPNGAVYGIDCEPRCEQCAGDRITVCIGSQKDVPFLQGVTDKHGPFDIIIDDGSHHGEDQKVSFETLYPSVKPGGVYIVEDLHASFWGDWGDFRPTLNSRIEKTLYPGGYGFHHGHGDVRNHPNWEQIRPHMDYFALATRAIIIYSSLVVFEKWGEESGWTRYL
jgi:SAM-dependent methyltransferase